MGTLNGGVTSFQMGRRCLGISPNEFIEDEQCLGYTVAIENTNIYILYSVESVYIQCNVCLFSMEALYNILLSTSFGGCISFFVLEFMAFMMSARGGTTLNCGRLSQIVSTVYLLVSHSPACTLDFNNHVQLKLVSVSNTS